MKLNEARMQLENGNDAVYVGTNADVPALPAWPMLAIAVADFEEAQGIVAILDRSLSRKPSRRKRAAKVSPPAPVVKPDPPTGNGGGAAEEVPKPDDPPCPAHADGRHVRTGGAPCSCEPANPDPVTPPSIGKTRAHRMVKQFEGGTDGPPRVA